MNAPQRNANVSNAIIESLSKYWRETDSGDFQVVIEGETFSCHSYLLQSCSEFFRCLLRSGMKENQEMKVELKNVSAGTFRLVLKTLYEGVDVLTLENFLEYWQAVDLLQIPFLIKLCEEFAIKNLCFDTLDSFKSQAEYLQSKDVLATILKFMLQKFDSCRKTEAFLNLSFEELKKLIKSDELVVDSEDSVILSVFDWVNYGEVLRDNDVIVNNERLNESMDASSNHNDSVDTSQATEKRRSENEDLTKAANTTLEKKLMVLGTKKDEPNPRKKILYELIKSIRYCLVSDRCYASLCQNKLVLNDIRVKNIILEATAYKQSCIDRSIYPSAATHRDCSNFDHVAIVIDSNVPFVFSFKREAHLFMYPLQKPAKFIVCMGKLYACSSTNRSTSIYLVDLASSKWLSVDKKKPMVKFWGEVEFCIGHKKCIYIFNGNYIGFYDPNSGKLVSEALSPNITSPKYALSFYHAILLFSPVKGIGGVEETSVYSWNPDTNVCKQLHILPFSCQNMVSFYDDVNSYIVDSNGSLWKLSNSNVIEFTFLANLWTQFTTPLRGAVLFKDTLYIVSDDIPPKYLFSLECVFTTIKFFKIYNSPCFVHYVMNKKYLDLLKYEDEDSDSGSGEGSGCRGSGTSSPLYLNLP